MGVVGGGAGKDRERGGGGDRERERAFIPCYYLCFLGWLRGR